MKYFIILIATTVYIPTHCWTHTFRNNSNDRINVATKRRSGETICHVILSSEQSQSCEAGGKCPEIIEISKVGSSRSSIYNIRDWNKCQHFEFTVRKQTSPTAAQEFVLEQRAYLI